VILPERGVILRERGVILRERGGSADPAGAAVRIADGWGVKARGGSGLALAGPAAEPVRDRTQP